ncbi:MAG: DUF2635 domain-containing protein [Desulfovibrio sp.]|nr:DUF2635 domain-containing protein [Desulfovibrio sp.]
MKTAFVRPARPGVLLRDPATGEAIPPEGALVTLSGTRAFWLRRVKDGDAEMGPEQPAGKAAATLRQAAHEEEQ